VIRDVASYYVGVKPRDGEGGARPHRRATGPAGQRQAAKQRGPWDLLDAWFAPKQFETERLYVRLGALILKRYVPTGGDVVMRWLRRRNPERRLIGTSPESLRRFERWTRIAEAVHLVGFAVFFRLALRRFYVGSLSKAGLAAATVLNLTLGLWPVVLQRYNRLRVCRAIVASSSAARLRRTPPS
jgi:Glycosyl-4,4'-diaponeurosporenoate acyltransferase